MDLPETYPVKLTEAERHDIIFGLQAFSEKLVNDDLKNVTDLINKISNSPTVTIEKKYTEKQKYIVYATMKAVTKFLDIEHEKFMDDAKKLCNIDQPTLWERILAKLKF